MTLEEAAADLYAQSPADFVRRRDELAAQARAADDRDLAAQIAASRKPTAGAWLANLLTLEHRGQLEELVALGAALRDAQEDLDADQLRELGRQRYQVVAALVVVARGLAAELGHPVGAAAAAELESTLTAALADPDAADALLSGQLTHALTYAGLGFGATAVTREPASRKRVATGPRSVPAKAVTGKGSAPSKEAADPRSTAAGRAAAKVAERKAAKAAELDAAERDLAQARLQAAEADARYEAAGQRHREALEALTAAREQVDRLTGELAEAQELVRAGQADLATAVRERDAAGRESVTATKRAERTARTVTSLRAR